MSDTVDERPPTEEAAPPRVIADPEIPPGAADAEAVGKPASLWSDAWADLRRKPIFIVSAVLILLMITMALFPQLFASADPRAQGACNLSNSLVRPSSEHIFGYDLQGCDYYTRTIYGARTSVSIGVVVTFFSVLIAVFFGSIAGYYGGVWDAIIARITDIWFAIPLILAGIAYLNARPRSFFNVAFILIVFGWPTMLRLMRSSVLAARDADYVDAARALGASDRRIIMRHILPNGITPVIVYATISVGVIIAAEATLSFLGVGLQLPAISWGLMISTAQNRILTAPHLLFFPGIFLSVTVFSFILMGDALRDALDPKLR